MISLNPKLYSIYEAHRMLIAKPFFKKVILKEIIKGKLYKVKEKRGGDKKKEQNSNMNKLVPRDNFFINKFEQDSIVNSKVQLYSNLEQLCDNTDWVIDFIMPSSYYITSSGDPSFFAFKREFYQVWNSMPQKTTNTTNMNTAT